ncbi:MAG: hypothetical protein O9325_05900 [Roseomonas sp.]|nr:hypothetical protein [Roseomonas sp.]
MLLDGEGERILAVFPGAGLPEDAPVPPEVLEGAGAVLAYPRWIGGAERLFAPAAGGVVGRGEGQVAAASGDDGDAAVEGVDELRRVGPDEGRGVERARRGGGWRVEAEAPGIGDGAAAVAEAGAAGLDAELGLHLTAGALDAAAHGTRSVTDLRLHRGAEVAAYGGGDEGHGGTPPRPLNWTTAMPYSRAGGR